MLEIKKVELWSHLKDWKEIIAVNFHKNLQIKKNKAYNFKF